MFIIISSFESLGPNPDAATIKGGTQNENKCSDRTWKKSIFPLFKKIMTDRPTDRRQTKRQWKGRVKLKKVKQYLKMTMGRDLE